MTLATLIEGASSKSDHAVRQLDGKFQSVDAVYDDDLWLILEHFSLLAPLDRGELNCYVTGVPLTRENIGGLIGTPDGPRLIADSYSATRLDER